MINQPLIQTLGYRSDLKLLIRIKNWGKEPTKPFKFTYSTDKGLQTKLVCFDGADAYFEEKRIKNGKPEVIRTPIELCDAGIRLRIEGPYFEPGRLLVERRFFEDRAHFDADNHDAVQDVTTSIELVDKDNKIIGDDYVDEVESPRGETTFEQAKRQGYKGTEEQYAQELMHLNAKADQIIWPTPEQGLLKIEGEKWPDSTGRLRQVYAFTLKGTTPPSGGGFMFSTRKIWQLQVMDLSVEHIDNQETILAHSLHTVGVNLHCYKYRVGGSSGGLAGSGVIERYRGRPYMLIGKCTIENE